MGAQQGDQGVIDAVSVCLGDRAYFVWMAATLAVRALSWNGDERAIFAACSRLEDHDTRLRFAARSVISEVAASIRHLEVEVSVKASRIRHLEAESVERSQP